MENLMHTSPQLDELFKALSGFQSDIHNVTKNQTNPHFQSDYADLGAGWAVVREHLATHGLSLSQWPVNGSDRPEGTVTIITLLGHSSGQFITSQLPVPMTKQDAQGVVSATTYGRRVAMFAALGLAPVDDDGQAAVIPTITDGQVEELSQMIVLHDFPLDSVLKYAKVTDLSQILSTSFKALVKNLEAKAAAKKGAAK